ncbi:MAG TPA: acyltransferase [Dictyobacter sp.]|jgi:peptidoglycan/LPS O-acetylase OafA/YrhL|nr:acyltransferase [Dictyobacter sp.]
MTTGQHIETRQEETQKKNTISVLDGVRAFACLIVIWFHIYRIPRDLDIWSTSPTTHPWLNSLLYFGQYGVTLFFVLSGFLLFLPFAKALLQRQNWPSIRRFYVRRVFRILPAYYLSLILIILLFQQQYLQPQHWKQLGLFFVFLMDSSQTTYKQLNAPFWTLAIEWQFYMFLPLLTFGMRMVVWRVRPSYRVCATMLCILLVIAWGIFTRYVGTYFQSQHPAATILVPRSVLNVFLFFTYGISGKYYEDFGVGMLLSLCFVYAQLPESSLKLRHLLQKCSPWLCGAGVCCLLVMVLWNYNQRYVDTWSFFSHPLLLNHYYLVNQLCISFSFGLCLLALLFGSSWLKVPFNWPILHKVGMISYSLYMWHLPFLLVFLQGTQSWLSNWQPLQAYWILWLWILLLVIPFCALFYRWVEVPGIKFGERFSRRKAIPVTEPSLQKVEATEIKEQVKSGVR